MLQVDLNCDMGESTSLFSYDVNLDLELLKIVSSINIACGFHAGDPGTMQTLVSEALVKDVAVGAHPSYEDRENFGRKSMRLSSQEIYNLIIYQCSALSGFLTVRGKRLHHVKPHGALYNDAAKEPELAKTICQAVADLEPGIQFYGLAGSCMKEAAVSCGLQYVSEVFADRSYQDDGSLTPRSVPGAMIENAADCLRQIRRMVVHKSVKTITGKSIGIEADTICIHSDGARALELANAISAELGRNLVFIESKIWHS